MKVLILTYYWPPAGGSGVQRWLKFVKYLPSFGITPVVVIPENASYPIMDASLQQEVVQDLEVLRIPIKEPNAFFSKRKGSKNNESAGFLDPNPSLWGKIIQYIRANYFIPDARKFWINPVVKALGDYLQHHKIDAMITTGPPHSLHIIGLKLKKRFGLRWIADFRDPWTEIDYFHQLPLTEASKNKHSRLEAEVLSKADMTIVVGKQMKENFQEKAKAISVITNGYDDELEMNENSIPDKNFSIVHIGMMNADRNPEALWKVLQELCEEDKTFASRLKIRLIGKVAKEIQKSVSNFDLKEQVEFISYLPHQEVIVQQRKAQLLLLPVNRVPSAKAIITGKVFEYLQAKRPILAIAPSDGDLAEIIKNTNSGVVVDFDDDQSLKRVILEAYTKFISGNLKVDAVNIEQYHRKNLTKQLSKILKESDI